MITFFNQMMKIFFDGDDRVPEALRYRRIRPKKNGMKRDDPGLFRR